MAPHNHLLMPHEVRYRTSYQPITPLLGHAHTIHNCLEDFSRHRVHFAAFEPFSSSPIDPFLPQNARVTGWPGCVKYLCTEYGVFQTYERVRRKLCEAYELIGRDVHTYGPL